MSSPKKRVLIVGAGISGLAAARHLQELKTFEVIVLEANDRIGGRIHTVTTPQFPTQPVELGALWLHFGQSNQHAVGSLCRRFQIPTKPHDKRRSMHIYLQTNQSVNEEEAIMKRHEFREIRDKVQHMYQQNEALNDEPVVDAVKKCFPDWAAKLEDPFHKYYSIPFMEGWTGDKKELISARFYDTISDQERRIEYHGHDLVIPNGYTKVLERLISGPNSLSQRLRIHLLKEVDSISLLDQQDTSKSIVVQTKDGDSYEADYVVVTVPLGILKASVITFNPPLSKAHTDAISRIGFGRYGKVLLVFDKIFWPEDVDFFFVKSDPAGFLLLYINLYVIHGLKGLLASTVGSGAYFADQLTDNEIIARARTSLGFAFGDSVVNQAKIVHFRRTDWNQNPLFRGAYSYGKVGMRKEDCYNIRRPIDSKIFFAGEHTTFPEDQFGTVNGAFLSGIRAATEIANTVQSVHYENIQAKL